MTHGDPMASWTPNHFFRFLLVGLSTFFFILPAALAASGEQDSRERQHERAAAETPGADREDSASGEGEQIVDEADPPTFPWVGEELYYSVLLRNSEAMRAGVRTGDIRQHRGQSYVPINGMVRSRGWFNAIYPVDDEANTFMNPTTFFPLRTEKTFEENNRFRSYDVDYHHHSFTAQVERKRHNRQSQFESPIPGNVHDMITWVYELRSVGNVSIGDTFSFYVYDGWLHSRVDLEVAEREALLTPIGWFKTWRLDFARQILDADAVNDDDAGPQPPDISIRERARHTGSLWLSRDVNMLPVRVTVDTMWGAGEAVIIRYVPGQAQ